MIQDYFTSTWGILTNLFILILFGLASYNIYAKRWSALTGKHSTQGKITWSELLGSRQNRILVSYSYRVDGVLYNGTIKAAMFKLEQTVANHPEGKEITVFYSHKDPGFSKANSPPGHYNIVASTASVYLFLPLLLLNGLGGFLFFLFHV